MPGEQLINEFPIGTSDLDAGQWEEQLFDPTSPSPPPVAPALEILSIVSTLTEVTITFTEDILAGDFAQNKDNWSIIGGNYNIVILDIIVNSDNIVLTTTSMVDSTSYTLTMPNQSIISATGGCSHIGPYVNNFSAVGAGPFIITIRTIDAKTIEAVYDRPVNELDAKNETNYAIVPTLKVYSGIQKISQSIYRLTTDPQTVGTSYAVTASNIRDY